MELTVMNKRRYDELVGKITNLELEISKAHVQLRAIQDSNNQLAEIAFDENKFTQQLLDRCEESAREAARVAIDIDDVVGEVVDRLDISDDVERVVNRLGCITSDEINDKIEEYVNDNDILNSNEVEETIDQYLNSNYNFIERAEVENLIEDALADFKEIITKEVIQAITNKLTTERGNHANNNRSDGVYISGTNEQSQGSSMLNASTKL